MAPRRATDVRAVRAPYHTVLADAIQLFQLIVINPAPIPIIYGAIETLIAEADFATHHHDPSPQRQQTDQATTTEINTRIAETLSDLHRAVVVVIAACAWLAAADSRDPRVQENQRLLGDALTAVGGLSTVLIGLHQAHAVALRGGTAAIPARPSHLPLLSAIDRPSASHLYDLPTAGTVGDRPAAPPQRSKPAIRSPNPPRVLVRRGQVGAGRPQAKGAYSFVTPPYVVVREEATGISPTRSSRSGPGGMAAR